MHNQEELITDEESAKIGQVSVETIRQYQRFGLLESVEEGGVYYFKKSNIIKLFNREMPSGPLFKFAFSTSKLGSEADSNKVDEFGADNIARVKSNFESLHSKVLKSWVGKKFEEQKETCKNVGDFSKIDNEINFLTEPEREEELGNGGDERIEPISLDDNIKEEKPDFASSSATQDEGKKDASHRYLSLQEQIEVLRNERDWLRERLERLEQRSEREQMLLMSSSETIRAFVSNEQQKKSFWNLALPWFKK